MYQTSADENKANAVIYQLPSTYLLYNITKTEDI